MLAYDALSLGKSLPAHRMLSRDAALEQAPGLNSKELLGAALYYDAQVEFAERLVVENALAAKDHGATVMTYARVEKFIVDQDNVLGVELTDLISNERHSMRGRLTINAGGPWVDKVAGPLATRRLIGGTKGVISLSPRLPARLGPRFMSKPKRIAGRSLSFPGTTTI